MTTTTTTQPTEKRVKPPACDSCKARRVLCHPQPDGSPCPRCAEKGSVCTTTPIPRGRPKGRKTQPRATASKQQATSSTATTTAGSSVVSHASSSKGSNSPPRLELMPLRVDNELDLDFIAQCFEGEFANPFNHPLILATSIQDDVRAASFHLHLLPPRTRVLALCTLAVSALISFHEAVLGPGPRPTSFGDLEFFASDADVRSCGVRRAGICRALHAEALRLARDADVMLEPSSENAASCYLLDYLDQTNLYRLSRPWAGAYISHVRALAPLWRATSPLGAADAAVWSAFLMAEALTSTEDRMPMLVTRHDQMLLTGTDTPPLDALLGLLNAAEKPGLYVLWPAMHPYMVHVTTLARTLYETINGDLARLKPLSEPTVINFLSALTTLHSILSLLLARIAASTSLIDAAHTPTPVRGAPHTLDSITRACAVGLVAGFAAIALPFQRELTSTSRLPAETLARERFAVFGAQAGRLAGEAAGAVARVIRWVPGVQFPPTNYAAFYQWAEFVLNGEPGDTGDLETITGELKLMAYSLDIYADPQVVSLFDRIDAYVAARNSNTVAFVDPLQLFTDNPAPVFDSTGLEGLFLPGDYAWLDLPPVEDGMMSLDGS